MGSGNGFSHAASSVIHAATFSPGQVFSSAANLGQAAGFASGGLNPVGELTGAIVGKELGRGIDKIRGALKSPDLPDPNSQQPPDLNQRAADTTQYSQSLAASQKQAITAGGTIFGKLEDNRRRIGDNPLAPRKSLLGL